MSSSQLIRSAPSLLLAVLFVLTDCVASQQTKIASTLSADIEGLGPSHGYNRSWSTRNFTSPIHWAFNFTDPMCKILETESAAQEILLRHLNEEGTKDQIIILLGGVGDAKSIEPIIHSMADEEEQRADPAAQKMNLVANIALTNITAAEVIWHRGGGIPFAKCPSDPKACWSAWWNQNKEHIEKEMDVSRNYSNYPNYGIYRSRKDH